jgi:hypothetical protein
MVARCPTRTERCGLRSHGCRVGYGDCVCVDGVLSQMEYANTYDSPFVKDHRHPRKAARFREAMRRWSVGSTKSCVTLAATSDKNSKANASPFIGAFEIPPYVGHYVHES